MIKKSPAVVATFVLMSFGCLSVFSQVNAPGAEAAEAFEQGVSLDLYASDGSWQRLPSVVPGQTPNISKRLDNLTIGPDGVDGVTTNYVVHIETWLTVDEAGSYQFRLTSDDGSRLSIDERVVVDHPTRHGMRPKVGLVHLDEGVHRLVVDMFQADGPQGLRVEWKPPSAAAFETIPDDRLQTEAGLTRVVSPGQKRFAADGQMPRPGDGRPLEAMHPMWRVTTIVPADDAPESFRLQVAGMTYLGDGRLGVTAFDPYFKGTRLNEPNGNLWILDGVDQKANTFVDTSVDLDVGDVRPGKEEEAVEAQRKADEARAKRTAELALTEPANAIAVPVKLAAEGFIHPLGVATDGRALFVAQRDEVTKLSDVDGDGFYEQHDTLASGWKSDNYHHFTFGPVLHNGSLYATLSVGVGLHAQKILRPDTYGTFPNPQGRGSLIRIDPAGGDYELVAGGLRTPNGLFVHEGELFVGENQGHWMPSNKINHLQPGRFYGYRGGNMISSLYPDGGYPTPFADEQVTPPAVHLPQNEIANSPTDGITLDEGIFAGQMLISDIKQGGLRRVSLERVHGELQGAAFRHSQGFVVGLHRLAKGDNGSIYCGGIGERRSWAWKRTQEGLQRLDPTGETAFEFQNVTATTDGLLLTFTKPIDVEQARDEKQYVVQHWNYRATGDYGGPKLNLEQLKVVVADVASDGLSVRLVLPNMRADRVLHLRADLASAEGEAMWSPEAWYTMNQIPGRDAVVPATEPVRVLIFTETAGFRHKSIEPGVVALKRVLRAAALDSVHVDDSKIGIFNDEELARFDVVVFMNTTGDVLDDEEQAAFERYIKNGGGFVGIHAATDTEYDWPWYTGLVGAKFNGHPKVQQATLNIIDGQHRSTAHLPTPLERTDEWYNFRDVAEDLNVLLTLDTTSFAGSTMQGKHPIAWYQIYDGGRSWYTGGGHTEASFADPMFLDHLLGGIRWAADLDGE